MACSDRPSWALLSVLGVPGWGPLHLLLKQRSDPAQIAQRLRQSLDHAGLPVSGCDVPGGRLLAALVEGSQGLGRGAGLLLQHGSGQQPAPCVPHRPAQRGNGEVKFITGTTQTSAVDTNK